VPVNWAKGSASGRRFTLQLSSGQAWVLFLSGDVEFEFDNMAMEMTQPFSGVLRAAILLDPEVCICNYMLRLVHLLL
jgi:hypothetical protein